MLYLIVFLGAGIGGALRHGVNVGAARAYGYGFPYGTLIVNVAGSFAMGLLAGFTTFSAFSLDTALLIERNAYGLALGYAVGSVAASVAALFLGLALFRTS